MNFRTALRPGGLPGVPTPEMCEHGPRAGHRQPALPERPGYRRRPAASIDTLCTGCVTGRYPTPCGQRLAQETLAEPAGWGDGRMSKQ